MQLQDIRVSICRSRRSIGSRPPPRPSPAWTPVRTGPRCRATRLCGQRHPAQLHASRGLSGGWTVSSQTGVVRRRDSHLSVSRPPPNHSNRTTTSEVTWRTGDDRRDDRAMPQRPPSVRSSTGSSTIEPGRRSSVGLAVKAPRRSLRRDVGQAVTAGLRFWRGRRLRGVLSAASVAPGLRPRFFSVLPTPASFRSR